MQTELYFDRIDSAVKLPRNFSLKEFTMFIPNTNFSCILITIFASIVINSKLSWIYLISKKNNLLRMQVSSPI